MFDYMFDSRHEIHVPIGMIIHDETLTTVGPIIWHQPKFLAQKTREIPQTYHTVALFDAPPKIWVIYIMTAGKNAAFRRIKQQWHICIVLQVM